MEVYNVYPEKEFDETMVENWIKTVVECIRANNEALNKSNSI